MPKDPISVIAGNRLKQLRLEKGWTQAQLAEKTGLSSNVISNLETGNTMLSYWTMTLLAGGLEVDISKLVEDFVKDKQPVSQNGYNK